jgi:hypothetical protein
MSPSAAPGARSPYTTTKTIVKGIRLTSTNVWIPVVTLLSTVKLIGVNRLIGYDFALRNPRLILS